MSGGRRKYKFPDQASAEAALAAEQAKNRWLQWIVVGAAQEVVGFTTVRYGGSSYWVRAFLSPRHLDGCVMVVHLHDGQVPQLTHFAEERDLDALLEGLGRPANDEAAARLEAARSAVLNLRRVLRDATEPIPYDGPLPPLSLLSSPPPTPNGGVQGEGVALPRGGTERSVESKEQ